jgi:murein L,D-transpeptidase YafK
MRSLLIVISFVLVAYTPSEPSFMDEQLGYSRVKQAFDEKWPELRARLQSMDIHPDSFDLFIRGFKFEEDVEIWVKHQDSSVYQHMLSYKFCSNVGALGPKRKQGDLQIPEGLYTLSKFNPESNFHLPLKINYPNLSDSLMGYSPQLGGLIFIHGGCSTIGCIPITDNKIKELYVLAVKARQNGQEAIPVHLFPVRMSEENMGILNGLKGRISEKTLSFWNMITPAYRSFEENHELAPYSIDSSKGHYHFH